MILPRTEALKQYGPLTDGGCIKAPGKFEGEPLYVPAFWELSGDGAADTLDWPGDTPTYLIEIDDSDRTEYPELSKDTVAVHLQESDQGFVFCEELDAAELEELRARNQAEWNEQEEESDEESES